MGISNDAFEKGKKPLEKGSLEYNILEFLKNAKKTNEPARNEKEILEGLNITPPKTQEKLDLLSGRLDYLEKVLKVQFALKWLELDDKIVSKVVKTEGTAEYITYYLAK